MKNRKQNTIIKYLLILILLININTIKAENNLSKDIKGNYTASTVASGEWTNSANWDQATAPDPTSDKCNLTLYHDITYNPTGIAPWLNPFDWSNNIVITIEPGIILTFNSDIEIWNNFDIIIKPGGQLIVNGSVFIKNNVDGVIDGEMYITGDLEVIGGGSSEIDGLGDLIVDGTISDDNNVIDPNLLGGIHRWLIVDNGTWGTNLSWSRTSKGPVAISGPNQQCIVHIENTYTGILNITTTIEKLDVQAGGVLNINPAYTLTVSNDITSDGDIIINSDANGTGGLIFNGATPVTATCERYVTANKYHYVSSPMTAAPISSYNVTSGAYTNPNFYYYDETETNVDWMYGWQQSTSGNLLPGLGYALYTTENYAYSLQGGELKNQDFDVTITNTATAGGSKSWNMIGNPFPCNLDADVFIDANDDATDFTGSLYFWDDDGTNGTDYSSADYLVYTKGGGTTNGPNGGIHNGTISPLQAFFVQANDACGNLSFTTAAKTASTGTFLKGILPIAETPLKMIRFSLSNKEGLYNDILIKLADDANKGIDIYDGLKLKGNQNIAFYSILEDEHYAIQGFPADSEIISIPLGIDANINSIYTIKAEDFVNIEKSTEIFLEDKESDAYINLRKRDYTFSLFGTNTERFVLHFKAEKENTLSDIFEPEIELTNIYTYENIVFINEIDIESVANVYDVTGKLITSKNINKGNNSFELNVKPGYYFIKLVTANKVNSKKIVIQ